MAMKKKPAKGATPPKAKHAKAENEVLADARDRCLRVRKGSATHIGNRMSYGV